MADGVHVAVASRAYKVNCNTALIETDDGVLVVDSHSKPSAARVVVEQIRAITPKPVRYVVNTHFHWDHWQGNEAYPSAYGHVEVITNDITREAIVRKRPEAHPGPHAPDARRRSRDSAPSSTPPPAPTSAQRSARTFARRSSTSPRSGPSGPALPDPRLRAEHADLSSGTARSISSTSGAHTPRAMSSSIFRRRRWW